MSDNTEQLDIDGRWNLEITRLGQALNAQIDPNDPRLQPVKRLFPIFEHLMQADPKEFMQLKEVNLDPNNPELVDAFNKGRVINSSMLLLSLIKNHLEN